MLRCGKHRGASFAQAAEDRGYSAWVLREVADGKRLHPNLHAFNEYLKDAHGGVLCVGKYKNRFFDEVFKDDPAYVAWAATVTDPGPYEVLSRICTGVGACVPPARATTLSKPS